MQTEGRSTKGSAERESRDPCSSSPRKHARTHLYQWALRAPSPLAAPLATVDLPSTRQLPVSTVWPFSATHRPHLVSHHHGSTPVFTQV